MKRAFLLLCILVAALAVLVDYKEEMRQRNQFKEFMLRFDKSYDTEEEAEIRFNHFKNSLQRVKEKNLKSAGNGATYGITKFSDLSPEEFDRFFLSRIDTTRPKGVKTMVPHPHLSNQLPKSIDWRDSGVVTPVKNQEKCGACWAFSAVENIESKWIMAGKANASDLSLSPQQLVDCSLWNQGCGGGVAFLGMQYVLNNGGVMSNASYPYAAKNQECQFNKSQVVAKIKTWQFAAFPLDEDTMVKNLVSWGPLSVCVATKHWHDYVSGVMKASECGTVMTHCVQLVGYNAINGTSTGYYIVRNSWGENWGINGYIHLEMGKDTCGLSQTPTSVFI